MPKSEIRMSLTVEEILQMLAFVQNDPGGFRQLFKFLAFMAPDRVDEVDVE